MEEIKQNEIYIAPYEAKNIYLRRTRTPGKKTDVNDGALIALFNEYYGGGMNTIVFQELRETRGLAYNAGAYLCTLQFARTIRITSCVTSSSRATR